GRPGNARDHLALDHSHRPLEHAPEDALLPPDVAFPELPVRDQAGEFGTGSGATGRAVVRLAGAQDEVAAAIRRDARPSAHLDLVDLRPARPGDAAPRQLLPDAPRVVGQMFHVSQVQLLPVVADQEKPVPAPGDVAANAPDARNIKLFAVS